MVIAGCTPTENKQPNAKFAPDKNLIFKGGSIKFNASTSKDPDGSIKTYSWDFGDGTKEDMKAKETTHTYGAAGVYNATLYVKDDKDKKSKTVSSIIVVAPPPAASSVVAETFTNITFSIDNSTLGGRVTDFTWSYGDGSTSEKGPSVVHQFRDNGTYSVSLTLLYQGQSASASLNVTINNRPPVANISIGSVAPYYTNKAISFSGAGSGDTDGQVAKWYWQFGDLATDNGSAVSHAYARPGNYTVSLTVIDNDNATASATMNLTIVKDLIITNVTVLVYKDDNNISRANVTVKFDNPGDAKAANTINITVTAFKADKSPISSGDFKKYRLFDAAVASASSGATATLTEILVDNTSPDGTWYFVELAFGGNVIDSGWYQKS
jgi:PKD repeat protein